MTVAKSPGTDHLPREFYKVLWEDILTNTSNFSYEIENLTISQKRGIGKFIPKKESDPILMKNLRPLTLFNYDYKIVSKAIANRIKTAIPELISDDQTGFLKTDMMYRTYVR